MRQNTHVDNRIVSVGQFAAQVFGCRRVRPTRLRDRDERRLSVQNTSRIANILRALDASRPEDMNLPGFRFHALVGRDRGRYAVNASGNRQIPFGWLEGDAIDVDLERLSLRKIR
jgi:proteic killer suppression protein